MKAVTRWIGTNIVAVCSLLVAVYTLFKVNEVHLTFNSKMDKYIELTQRASKAEGVKEEKERVEQIPN